MYTTKDLIQDLEQFNEWAATLLNIEEKQFFEPIAEGKWGIAEIITHISYWDTYILTGILPEMKQDTDIQSIEIEKLNQEAEVHARSGLSQEQIIQEQQQARNALLIALKARYNEDEAFFDTTFQLNGESLDEHSGYPHSVFNYFSGFVWHDNHHRRQIEGFLKEQKQSVE
ncbi:DinB family protein [Oceanobacillus manasiensis]|uniref:DinB family protein n=1 Tax=Oceanobacillus manasiensis TaxID=586413 RepID=UPI0005AA40F7|nr:DinB family protein [Oceanobacillus manasiensis]